MISTERAKDLRDALKSDILRADESQAQLLKSAENRRHALERGGGAEVILLKADQLIQRLGCPVIKLHTAAGRGNAAALQSLLDSGVSANATDDMKQGWTSLHAAAENDHAEVRPGILLLPTRVCVDLTMHCAVHRNPHAAWGGSKLTVPRLPSAHQVHARPAADLGRTAGTTSPETRRCCGRAIGVTPSA